MITLRQLCLFRIKLAVLCCMLCMAASSSAQNQLLTNPGFETVHNGHADGWRAYGAGYTIDASVSHSGIKSLRVSTSDKVTTAGAVQTITLNQTTAAPILISAWSRQQDVDSGQNEQSTYSLYTDVTYTDGTALKGQMEPFRNTTTEWQSRKLVIAPSKPIASIAVCARFEKRKGTVWFDDLSAVEIGEAFDSQAIAPPRVAPGFTGGWFARDVAANSAILPLTTGQANTELHLILQDPQLLAEGRIENARLQDTSGTDRAVTLYYVERFRDSNTVWWNDIRNRVSVLKAYEMKNLGNLQGGATDTIALYPFACVTGLSGGRALGAGVLSGRVVRTGYHAPSQLLYVAFDFGLTASNLANNDGAGHGTADVSVVHYNVNSAWGFRDASSIYYRLFPNAFARRGQPDGIWVPFTDPAKIPGIADFHFKYHETDRDKLTKRQVESDDSLGILTLRYSEPDDHGFNMAPPLTYANALATLQQEAASGDEADRAVLNTGVRDETGKYQMQFQNFPWLNGPNWLLNDSPNIPWSATQPSGASITYTRHIGDTLYGPGNRFSPGVLDGEYVDSLETWDVLDYGPKAVAYAATTPTFSNTDYKPVVAVWMSTYELLEWMSRDLHQRGKILMANTTPINQYANSFVLDVMGTEVDWNPGRVWSPDSDAALNLRRTMSYQKPYQLLMNTDFRRFGPTEVQRYFERSMLYGIFPSMFSADASSSPYFEEPALYNRDRAMFKTYIPVIETLSGAGWQPVTYTATNNPHVLIERFGNSYLTVLNDSSTAQRVTVTLELSKLCGADAAPQSLQITDMVTRKVRATVPASPTVRFSFKAGAQRGYALQLKPKLPRGTDPLKTVNLCPGV
jgi:hypothetical protein